MPKPIKVEKGSIIDLHRRKEAKIRERDHAEAVRESGQKGRR